METTPRSSSPLNGHLPGHLPGPEPIPAIPAIPDSLADLAPRLEALRKATTQLYSVSDRSSAYIRDLEAWIAANRIGVRCSVPAFTETERSQTYTVHFGFNRSPKGPWRFFAVYVFEDGMESEPQSWDGLRKEMKGRCLLAIPALIDRMIEVTVESAESIRAALVEVGRAVPFAGPITIDSI